MSRLSEWSLRSRFGLLLASVAATPIVSTLAILALWNLNASNNAQGRLPETAHQWIHQAPNRETVLDQVIGILKELPGSSVVARLDAAGRVVESLSPAYEKDQRVFELGPALPAGISPDTPSSVLARIPYTDSGGTQFMLLLEISKAPQLLTYRARVVQAGLIVFAASLVVATVLSSLLIRSIRNSLVSFQRAALAVSEGKLDQTLRSPVDELSDLARSFNDMRHSLIEEEARRARFIMAVSHDLKTPLALIGGYVEALQDRKARSETQRQHYLDIVTRRVRELESLIYGLIDYTRLSTSEWVLRFEEIGLFDWVGQFVAEVRESFQLESTRIDFVCDNPSAISERKIRMDPELVRRALDNIVSNAIKYGGPTCGIEVRLCEEQSKLVLYITDDGPGIPETDLPFIKDPFVRSGSNKLGGHGLGLAIVDSILRSHGFDLVVGNAKTGGAELRIDFGAGI